MRKRGLLVIVLLGLALALHLVALRWDLRRGVILGFLSPRDGWTIVPAAVFGLGAPLLALLALIGSPPRRLKSWRGRAALVLVLGVLPVAVAGTVAAATGAAPRAVWPFGLVWIFVILLVAILALAGQHDR